MVIDIKEGKTGCYDTLGATYLGEIGREIGRKASSS